MITAIVGSLGGSVFLGRNTGEGREHIFHKFIVISDDYGTNPDALWLSGTGEGIIPQVRMEY